MGVKREVKKGVKHFVLDNSIIVLSFLTSMSEAN